MLKVDYINPHRSVYIPNSVCRSAITASLKPPTIINPSHLHYSYTHEEYSASHCESDGRMSLN
jgi:hypothetical protein